MICPGWTVVIWWPQFVKVRTKLAPNQLPLAVDYLRFPKGSEEKLSKMDPLDNFY